MALETTLESNRQANTLDKKIVVLVGGVGGAKLAYGLAKQLDPEHLTIIVNVADDFWHYGLRITPDADTILYTLAEWVDPVNGWGISGDTRAMLETMRRYGEDAWFGLGDRDLATHLIRTKMLREGARLTEVARRLAHGAGVQHAILPVTDDEVATIVDTVEYGELAFQTYFVRHRWQPVVKGLRYAGIEAARITPEVETALSEADAILIAPSNPWLSVEPVLAVPGMRDLIKGRNVPRIVVTPIIGGQAVKGPAAKLMAELGLEVTPESVARFYSDVITGFVDDEINPDFTLSGLKVVKFNTLMTDNADKINLAYKILRWLEGYL